MDRRHKGSRTRIVGSDADPVLCAAYLSPTLLKPGSRKQSAMYLQELLERELFVAPDAPHRVDHGLDVTEHLGGCDVGALLSDCSRGLGFKQASRPDLKAFDPRGGDGLGAQQQAGQRLRVD